MLSLTIQNQFLILAGILILGFGVFAFLYSGLQKKIKTLLGGNNSTDESIQQDIIRRLTKTEVKIEEFEPRLEIVESISKMSIQKTGFVRFNPFENTGGDNSFIVALLDRANNGVLISSLYTRDGVRVYAKSVEKGKSKYPLSDEETQILQKTIEKS